MSGKRNNKDDLILNEEENLLILKVNDTNKFNITMNLGIDYEAEEITIHIKHWEKQNGTISGYDYPASEFSAALAKFEELENSKLCTI